VIAAPEVQLRLLDLQALDAKLDQLAHRRRTLPGLAEHAALELRCGQLADLLVAAAAAETDLAREQVKAEAAVDQVRAREERDRGMLDGGHVGAKEAVSLQSELDSLARRQTALEDEVLEVMERVEAAAARSAELAKQRDAAEADRDRAAAQLATDREAIDKDAAFARQQRGVLAVQMPADLLALYEKIRAQYGGIGAAAIVRRRCEGCRLELDISEVNALKAAAPDAVLRHDSCRRIIVRTSNSGL
jgi:predicted  nucleic acid-binding Zn-ribbon protein